MNNNDLFEALDALEKEKGIKAADVVASITNAVAVAVRKYYNVAEENVEVEIDSETQKFKVLLLKEVVDEVTNPASQISLEEALQKNKRMKVGSTLSTKLDTKQIGRIAALSGKNLIHQGINDAVKAQLMEQYRSKVHEVVNAKVIKVDNVSGNATVMIDKNEAILFKNEQIPNEVIKYGDNIKVYVSDVMSNERRCSLKITRMGREIVKRLFENEVPEIFDGTVEIKSISREEGSRSKIAVLSKDENVDPIGACVGQKYSRISRVVAELNGEKIDVVKYYENPAEFIAQALAPAQVIEVRIPNPDEKICRTIVPDNQLSLAIGNKGQNVKLAAKLTGYKIDIRPESSPEPEVTEEEPETSADAEASEGTEE